MPIMDNDNRNSDNVTPEEKSDAEHYEVVIEYNGDYAYVADRNTLKELEVDFSGEVEGYFKSIAEKYPEYAPYINANFEELLKKWDAANNMAQSEARQAEHDRIVSEMAGGGYGDDEANAKAEEKIAKLVTEKEPPLTSADISEIRGKSDKSIADYLAIHKSLVHRQQNTMIFYKGFAERKLEKLGNLIGKQENINHKIQRRENKAKKYENKIARLSDTSKMLSSFFEGKKTPALIGFAIRRNESRIEKLREKKIPRNDRKFQRLQDKSVKNHLKMESTIAKTDKLQALSSVVKSFNTLDPTKRREQFTAAMDELHNASERAVTCKIEKCGAKIAKLKSTLPEKQTDYSISDIEAEEKIERLEAKKDALTQKLDKLKDLQKPFSELDESKSDKLAENVKEKVDSEVQNIENGKQCSDFAEDIAVYATEKANELTSEKNITAERKKPSLDERINKAKSDNPQHAKPKQEKQQTKKQEQSL